MIPLTLQSISLTNVGFVVILMTPDGQRKLPIFIGITEAQAIALQVNEIHPPRPMTHDLMKNLLDHFKGRLERVVIHDLAAGTFYARLEVVSGDRRLEIDARPSDAIALSLCCRVPIYVAEKVIEEAGVAAESIAEDGEQSTRAGRFRTSEGVSSPRDELSLLREELQQAIEDERYEEAARIRDDIKQQESRN